MALLAQTRLQQATIIRIVMVYLDIHLLQHILGDITDGPHIDSNRAGAPHKDHFSAL